MQYFKHLEDNSREAAAQDFAEQNISRIKDQISNLTDELRFWKYVVELTSKSVCQSCNDERSITWYPDGTGPGQGTRTSVPCPECRETAYAKETKRINAMYRR